MNYKRHKPRRQVRCTLCTKLRWLGNSSERKTRRDLKQAARANDVVPGKVT